MHAYLAGNDSKDLKYNAICLTLGHVWAKLVQITPSPFFGIF